MVPNVNLILSPNEEIKIQYTVVEIIYIYIYIYICIHICKCVHSKHLSKINTRQVK